MFEKYTPIRVNLVVPSQEEDRTSTIDNQLKRIARAYQVLNTKQSDLHRALADHTVQEQQLVKTHAELCQRQLSSELFLAAQASVVSETNLSIEEQLETSRVALEESFSKSRSIKQEFKTIDVQQKQLDAFVASLNEELASLN